MSESSTTTAFTTRGPGRVLSVMGHSGPDVAPAASRRQRRVPLISKTKSEPFSRPMEMIAPNPDGPAWPSRVLKKVEYLEKLYRLGCHYRDGHHARPRAAPAGLV